MSSTPPVAKKGVTIDDSEKEFLTSRNRSMSNDALLTAIPRDITAELSDSNTVLKYVCLGMVWCGMVIFYSSYVMLMSITARR